MANDSDPDYDPSESEGNSNGDENISGSSRSAKRSDSDEENDSYYSSENISKKNKLILKPNDDKDSSFKSSEFSGSVRPPHVAFIYLCSFCFFQTPFRFNLKKHSKHCKKSYSKKYWECPKCDVKYTLEDLLDEHSIPIDQDSIDKHIFHCPVCSFGADEKSKPVILEKVYPIAKHLICPKCKVKITNINALKKHLIHKHDVTVLYKCQYCEYSTSKSERLQDHRKSHADLQEMGCIQCSHCHLEFFTMGEFKIHMKQVQWVNERYKKDLELEEEGDGKKLVVKVEEDFGSFLLEEGKVNFTSLDEVNIRNSADIGKWQLKCTLCQYVNYSKASCQRHVKNKHRPFGHSVVRFNKYHEDEFKGSINIGKIKDEGLLKILDWTQSDEEDIPEETVTAARNEVITIQIASDAEDENEDHKQEIDKKKEKTTLSVKAGRQRSFNCAECNYQARYKLHLSIHQLLIHEMSVENGVFKCPKQHCKFSTRSKPSLRNHIKRFHKLRIDMFYAPDLKCPDCVYMAKKPVHLLIHKTTVHKGRTTNKLRCRQCDANHEATYQAAWHKFKCHSDNSELRKWRLKCMVCNYKNSVKLDCRRHGLQHKIPHVKFQKYYEGKLKGAVGFRYSQTENNPLKLKVETGDSDKVLMTQNKNLATELHVNQVDEAGGIGKSNDSNGGDLKRPKELDGDVDMLLQKKAEFFTCDRCNYETTNESYLPLHDLLVHGAATSSNSKYHCIECNKFESKYRHNFKRHLQNFHCYNTNELYTKQQAGRHDWKDRKVKVENLPCHNYCQFCGYKFNDKYLLDWHMFRAHRDKTELRKWLIRCKLCSYATYSTRYAQAHASVRHSNATKSVTVIFDKYYENEFDGNFLCQIGRREIHKCLKCNYTTITWKNLRRHYRRHGVRSAKKSSTRANEREEIDLPSALSREQEKIERVQVSMTLNKNVTTELHVNKVDEAGGIGKSNDSNGGDLKRPKELDGDVDMLLQKKAEFFTCDRCNYETTKESYLPLHDLLVHGAAISSNSKYQCIECNKFESKYKHDFKTHLEKCHCYNTNELYTKQQADRYDWNDIKVKVENLPCHKCQICAYKFYDKYLLDWHMFEAHRDKTELRKWLIRCKLCSYATYSTKYAQVHASVRHCDATKSVTVIFDKYYENEFGGNFLCQIGKREIHKCLKCNYATITRENLRHHYRRHDVRRAKKSSTKAIKREEIDLPSALSRKHERIETVQGEANSHNEIEQNEIIKIEITSDGDDEANESKDVSEDMEFETNEDSVPGSDDEANESGDLSPELDEDSVPSKRHKTYSRKQVIATSGSEKGANIDDGLSKPAPINYPFVCQKCKNGYEDRYLLATHMLKEHRDKTELSKWSLRCQSCSYKTGYARKANKHGLLKHGSASEPVVVQFRKFYENVFEGTFTYRYARKILGCSLCEYVTNDRRNLTEHLKRHRKDSFRPRPQLVLHEKTSNEEATSVRGQKKEADSGVEERRRKTDSGSYNRQQILDIIGLPGVEVKTAEDNLVGKCKDNEAEGNVEENLKLVVNGEVITIEITPDENESMVNPFTGEFVPGIDEDTPEISFPKSKSFKCSKIRCKYSFDSLKEVTDHIKSCTHKNARRIGQRFTCHLCKDVMTIRSALQDHRDAHASALNNPELVVVFSEHMNDRFTCDIEIKTNNRQAETKRKDAGPQQPAKIWYKCWMCGSVVVTKVSLKTHTNIHAREDDNFNLKVRYSRYCDEKSDGTIVMHADRNYEPPRKKPARSPEPEYDISQPVFGCDECNYKTNDEEALKKHKNLHWTPEKAALFKAKKWFTCSVCFFHCFDLKKFNEHCEWHKKHYTNTGGIGKMGKDSWFLK